MSEVKPLQNSRESLFSQEIKNRIVQFLFVLFAITALLVILIVRLTFLQIKEISVADKIISQGEVLYCIDSIDIPGTVDITGWAVDPNEPLPYSDCFVLLKDMGSGRYYQIKTAAVLRGDLSEHFDMPSARFGGFRTRIHIEQLDASTTYQIYLLYFDKLVETNYQFSLNDYTEE